MQSYQEKDIKSNSESDQFITRMPISILDKETKHIEKDESEKLSALREKIPEGYKVGAAVGAGDCFFDSVAQGLNELKSNSLITSSKNFDVKSLREDCADCANKYENEIIGDAEGGGYFVAQKNVAFLELGNIQDRKGRDVPDRGKTFNKYLEDIKKIAKEEEYSIWGRPEIEGRIICERYKVQIKVIELREEPVDGLHITTGKVGTGGNVIYIVNYRNHFVPLLNKIEEDIKEDKEVAREEVYGVVNKSSPSLLEDTRNYGFGKSPINTEGSSSCKQSSNLRSKQAELPILGHLEDLTSRSNAVKNLAKETKEKIEEKTSTNKCTRSSPVFCCNEFKRCDLENDGRSLEGKFNEIIKDLKENNHTNLGDVKLIHGKGSIKYFRAKLSDKDRLLFKAMKCGDKDVFVILEVILNHDYRKSKFLTDEKKIKDIKIIDQDNKEVSDNAGIEGIEDAPQVRWLGKFITLSATQENIVENAGGKYNLPLIVSGSAGSGKTSVALEKIRKIEEEFKEGKILYITKSENLIKKSKELYEYAYYDEVAKEEKTGVPEQIEFLSVHEFIERVTKEDRKRVEGKRPINRNAFLTWFEDICKKKNFCEYKKDGDKIFEEFTAVIAGEGLGEKQYEELGNRQATFLERQRNSIYGLFKEYKKFIEGSSEYYDTSLIAHEFVEKVQADYDAVVVDEVQDLTESILKLILKSLKDKSKSNFLLCGDVNQVIHPSFFSVSRLKSFLRKGNGHELRVCTLEKNHRNSKQVIELANRILHLKNYCFASEDKMTADEKEAFFMKSDTEKKGNVGFIAKGEKQEIAGKVSESTNWAVLVLNDEGKEDARKLLKLHLCLIYMKPKAWSLRM